MVDYLNRSWLVSGNGRDDVDAGSGVMLPCASGPHCLCHQGAVLGGL